MENIRESLNELKSLVRATDESNKEFNNKIIHILDAILNKVEGIEVNVEALDEDLSLINDDLSEVQDELFEELSIEELEEYDDEYCEVKCPECDKTLFVEKSVLKGDGSVPCPYCNGDIKI